ncbi:unnamed protein product [Adineta ricciae]|uniref:Uncharacterized protein n=1 Tax=Adineta ricciae TaxID=249248 RepID=A0A814WP95_ADIRI|nr:unnamed protein product [Adineta ricciae]
MLINIQNDSYHHLENRSILAILCANMSTNGTHGNCTTLPVSSTSASTFKENISLNSMVIIFVLSILSLFGVCFMIFGPLQRSEAYKRVENFTFGQTPIFNVDHREASTPTRFDETLDFADE